MGYIYLIGQADTPNIYKIGCTRGSLEKRKKALQTGNAEELFIRKSYETEQPFKLEKLLHNRFFSKQYINEWYELTDEDVNSFVETCDKLQEIINALKDNPFY